MKLTYDHVFPKIESSNSIAAFHFNIQKSKPTLLKPNSSSYWDHLVTSCQVNTETIKTRKSDHYTVIGELSYHPFIPILRCKNHKNKFADNQRQKTLNFLLILDQKLQKKDELGQGCDDYSSQHSFRKLWLNSLQFGMKIRWGTKNSFPYKYIRSQWKKGLDNVANMDGSFFLGSIFMVIPFV